MGFVTGRPKSVLQRLMQRVLHLLKHLGIRGIKMNSLDSLENFFTRSGVRVGNRTKRSGLYDPQLADLLCQTHEGRNDILVPSIHSVHQFLKRNPVPHANPSMVLPMLASGMRGVDSPTIGGCI